MVADRPGDQFDIGREQGVGGQGPHGMLADDIQHGRVSATRVVQIREAVGEARPEMEQAHRELPRHSAIAVGGAGRDVLVKAEDASKAGNRIHRQHQRHFRGAGIGETDFDALAYSGGHQCIGTIHVAIHASRN